jgi:ABC-type transport system involved in multi-copper enzyme maturation permease subunit
MTNATAMPRTEDLFSVGSRVSWAAILGGGLVSLALYFMFATLGAAVGLSVSDRVRPGSLQTGAVIWSVLTLCIALFVGGVMASLFTVGENKVESIFYGVIMWAFLLFVFLCMAAFGVGSGISGTVGLARVAQASGPEWEASAREAGVPSATIDEWRRKTAEAASKANDPQTQQELKAAATRVAWYAFGGTWLSMIAAAAGSWVGAGPTFRIVTVSTGPRTLGAGV